MPEHDNHGNTPAAWTGVGIWCAASVAAALVLIFGSLTAFIIVTLVGTALGAIVWKLMAVGARRRAASSGTEQHQVDQPA
jgi:hypothetical protein